MTGEDDGQQQLRDLVELAHGFGETVPVNDTLAVLAEAGLDPVVESYDTLRLSDGRRARFASRNPFPPVPHPAERADVPELVLLSMPGSRPTFVQVAQRVSGLLLVDLGARQVWDRGRVVGEPGPFLGTSLWRYSVFAVARTILTHTTGTTELADIIGLNLPDTAIAIDTLRDHIHHTRHGWVANDPGTLTDFVLHSWPGAGGVLTRWTAPLPLAGQAELLLAQPGVLLTGEWAAQLRDDRIGAITITAYTPAEINMAAHGFQPAPRHHASVSLVFPEDPTIFATSHHNGPPGCTDDVITTAEMLRSTHIGDGFDDAALLRQRLHTLHRARVHDTEENQ